MGFLEKLKAKYSDTLRYLVSGLVKQAVVGGIAVANSKWSLGLTNDQIVAIAIACATVTAGQVVGQAARPVPAPVVDGTQPIPLVPPANGG